MHTGPDRRTTVVFGRPLCSADRLWPSSREANLSDAPNPGGMRTADAAVRGSEFFLHHLAQNVVGEDLVGQ